MADFTSLDDLRRDKLDAIGGDGKADAVGRGIKLWIDGGQGWNAYQVALHVYQCAAAIAGVDGGIGLDSIGNNGSVLFIYITSKGTDNGVCDCLGNTQWIANGQYVLSYQQLRGVTQGDGR